MSSIPLGQYMKIRGVSEADEFGAGRPVSGVLQLAITIQETKSAWCTMDEDEAIEAGFMITKIEKLAEKVQKKWKA